MRGDSRSARTDAVPGCRATAASVTVFVALAVVIVGLGSAAVVVPGGVDRLVADDAGGAVDDASRALGTDTGSEATADDGGDGDDEDSTATEDDWSVTVVTGDGDDEPTDSDGDGLPDAVERDVYGTDPTAVDTDGDGFPDGVEVTCGETLPGADPLRQDVYVELDAVEGVDVSDAAVDRLEATFAEAPVENPDGSTGIAFHVRRSDDDLPQNGSVNSHERDGEYNDILDYRTAAFDHRGDGYYYVLVAQNVSYRGEHFYVGAGRRGIAVLQSLDSPELTASLFAHELGHSFGLDRHQDGIDGEDYSLEEYESVMSYNGLYEVTTYSDGDDDVGRDEWQFVAEDRYVPSVDCGDDGDCLASC